MTNKRTLKKTKANSQKDKRVTKLGQVIQKRTKKTVKTSSIRAFTTRFQEAKSVNQSNVN